MLSAALLLFANTLLFSLRLSGGGSFPKPLTAAEEKDCLRRYAQGDMAARDILIERNLRLVAHIAEKGNAAGITVAICGQAGQDPLLLPLWLAMGIGELSVSPTSVLGLRRRLSGMTKADCRALLERVLRMQTAQEVVDALREFQTRTEESR